MAAHGRLRTRHAAEPVSRPDLLRRLEYATQPGPFRFVNELKALEFREISDWLMLALAATATFALGRRSVSRPSTSCFWPRRPSSHFGRGAICGSSFSHPWRS